VQPKNELVLFNLGQAYQMDGRNADALKSYQKYLSSFPKGQYVPLIANMVRVMQTQVLMSRGASSSAQDNYLNEAIAGGGCRWAAEQVPVKVYIASADGVNGFKPEYAKFLKDAFAEWATATDTRIKFSFVENMNEALVKCRWTANPKDLANPGEGGQAFVAHSAQGAAVAAELLICTKPDSLSGAQPSEKFMKHICLHEVGHVLGMPGHSSSPNDVMFSLVNPESVTGILSERDKKTAKALYSLGEKADAEPKK
jgi:predicted Zn-dependent protease